MEFLHVKHNREISKIRSVSKEICGISAEFPEKSREIAVCLRIATVDDNSAVATDNNDANDNDHDGDGVNDDNNNDDGVADINIGVSVDGVSTVM